MLQSPKPKRSMPRQLLARAALLTAYLTLPACADLINTVGASGSPSIPCSVDPPIIWGAGDDAELLDVLTKIASGEIKPPDAIPTVRTAAGDTDATIAQIKDRNAVYDAVCPAFVVPLPKPPDAAGLKPSVTP